VYEDEGQGSVSDGRIPLGALLGAGRYDRGGLRRTETDDSANEAVEIYHTAGLRRLRETETEKAEGP
jgi:hypothetical protein